MQIESDLFFSGNCEAFEALAEGGQVTMQFAPPLWGGHFGMLADRFGVPWMVPSEH